MIINVLGTDYEIRRPKRNEDKALKSYDGYCDSSIKVIAVEDFEQDDFTKGDLKSYAKQVIRHELIHAFLNESGLQSSSDWANNEEMVDYFAIQIPKIIEAMRKADTL